MSGPMHEPSRFTGRLWVVEPPLIEPLSWLNEPEYAECRASYEYAARHFTVMGDLLTAHGMSAENACLIWKCMETGHAVVRFRERQGRLPR